MSDALLEEPPADPRDALIRDQARVISAQGEKITALEVLVADLREQLSAAERTGSRNSGNSSMPPSSDDLPGRKPPRKQRRAAERAEAKKRKPGKQPGSPGASMSREAPDRTEDHYPEGACSCGLNLARSATEVPGSGIGYPTTASASAIVVLRPLSTIRSLARRAGARRRGLRVAPESAMQRR